MNSQVLDGISEGHFLEMTKSAINQIKDDSEIYTNARQVDDPFVQSVIDESDIFAEHELNYLESNCEYKIRYTYEDLQNEIDDIKRKREVKKKTTDDYKKWTRGMFEREDSRNIREWLERMDEIADEDGYFMK